MRRGEILAVHFVGQDDLRTARLFQRQAAGVMDLAGGFRLRRFKFSLVVPLQNHIDGPFLHAGPVQKG